MLKVLLLSVFTLTLTLGCSCKVDNDVKCGAKSDKTHCPLTDTSAAKGDCEADCDKPCCADKGDAAAKEAQACPTDCDKPCCADKGEAKDEKAACPPDCTKPCCAKTE